MLSSYLVASFSIILDDVKNKAAGTLCLHCTCAWLKSSEYLLKLRSQEDAEQGTIHLEPPRIGGVILPSCVKGGYQMGVSQPFSDCGSSVSGSDQRLPNWYNFHL